MTEKEWRHNISITLKQKMDEANLTQFELAKASHLSQGSISNYLNERSVPDIRAAINLSVALKCTTDQLFDFGERVE